MKINSTFKSKVMKAAWTSFRKGGKSFSAALTSAWAWAKRTLVEAYATVSFTKQTDKAVLVAAQLACPFTDQVQRRDFWAPKSLLVNGQLPMWFLNKKADELKSLETYQGARSLELELL